MKKKVSLLCLLAFAWMTTTCVQAAPVSSAVALRAATVLLSRQPETTGKPSLVQMPLEFEHLYLFADRSGHGFAIVSADDCVLPVVGFSATSPVSQNLPCGLRVWLRERDNEIAEAIARGEAGSKVVSDAWQSLVANTPLYAPSAVVVSPMVATRWDQSPYYNQQCPYDNSHGSRVVTGCVATAMAQIMKFWSHPLQGTGSHAYTSANYGSLSADFGSTTYAWSMMPNTLSATSTSAQVDAVAKLMFHCGVAVDMNYQMSGSGSHVLSYGVLGAACTEHALREYFGYDGNLHGVQRNGVSDSVWSALLDIELSAGRPVLYCGADPTGGHAWVCDGSNAAGQYHMNWGWGGYADGYFTMGALNPGRGGSGGNSTYTFNLNQEILVGVQPAAADSADSHTVVVSSSPLGTVAGGGTFPVGGTTQISATARDGYRFASWNDMNVYNPRGEPVYADINLTPIFAPVARYDTMAFDNGQCLVRYGFSGTFTWGIRLTPNDRASLHRLRAVMLFAEDNEDGDYMLKIYQGGTTSPGTLLATHSFTKPGTRGWYTTNLDEALDIDPNQPVWITVTCLSDNISYPVACSNYAGRDDSRLYTRNGYTWSAFTHNYSWMIRALFAPTTATQHEVTVGTQNAALGYAVGSGLYADSALATLQAVAHGCNHFESWSDGSTENPRHVCVTDDLQLVAQFAAGLRATEEVQACDSLTWNGRRFVESTDTATFATVSVAGCDSLTTLHLILSHAVETAVYDTTSDEVYPWHGQFISTDGDYRWTGSSDSGCDSTVTLHVVFQQATASIEQPESSTVRLYPNPANDRLRIESDRVIERIEIYDLAGRRVMAFEGQNELDIVTLPAGTYLLKVSTDLSSEVLRMVKQ